jgi:hypothetical protein
VLDGTGLVGAAPAWSAAQKRLAAPPDAFRVTGEGQGAGTHRNACDASAGGLR